MARTSALTLGPNSAVAVLEAGEPTVIPSGRGDLLVIVEVAVPRKLSPAEGVEALAKVLDQDPRAHLGVRKMRSCSMMSGSTCCRWRPSWPGSISSEARVPQRTGG